jgi:hypothetical protein
MRHFVRRRTMLGVATLSVAALALAGCAAEEEAADTAAVLTQMQPLKLQQAVKPTQTTWATRVKV